VTLLQQLRQHCVIIMMLMMMIIVTMICPDSVELLMVMHDSSGWGDRFVFRLVLLTLLLVGVAHMSQAAQSYRSSSVVVSFCRSACPLVASNGREFWKNDRLPIMEMPFGVVGRVRPKNHVLDGVQIPPPTARHIFGVHNGATWEIRLNSCARRL